MTMSASKERVEAEEWSPESEIQLFLALDGLKPVGINKYFFMACIADRLSKALNREIGTDAIWTHLKTMYNLAALDEMEPLPFPNDQREFALPEAEFSSLLHRKKSTTTTTPSEGPETPAQITKPEKNITLPATPLSSSSAASSQEKQHHASRTSLNGASGQSSSSTTAASHNANPTSGSVHGGNSEEKRSSSNASSASRAQPLSRPPKRTRGSMSLESNSPSTTPPPVPVSTKRRRI